MRLYNNLSYNTFFENDLVWLSKTLNWEEFFFLYLDNFNLYSFLSTPFFVNNYIFLDSQIKFSFLDMVFLSETSKINMNRELYDLFFWDFFSFVDNNLVSSNFLFYTNYQDFFVLILFYNPELVPVLVDFINNYWILNSFNLSTSFVYDLFSDKLFLASSVLINYFILFFFLYLINYNFCK